MSCDLLIGEDSWNSSCGNVAWVLEVASRHVESPEVAKELRAFTSGYVVVEDFGRSFGAEACEQIVEALRTKLLAAVRAEFDGVNRDYLVPHVEELIAMAERWRGFAVEAGQA
ncbi:hypothetical protein AB0M48_07060 [Lentzea sp. NPDC051208]|uniref:hypothetical protein n=1 Tax=Lentzea sp. NPDC051208 TaxID=3154642 RepID=UPI00342650BA